MYSLNTEQNKAPEFAVGGHNVVLCGQVGTGKSVTIKTIFKLLKEAGKNVKRHFIQVPACVTSTVSFGLS